MLTLLRVINDIKNKKPNKRSDKSHPAFYKNKTNMRKKIEPCLKGHGISIYEHSQLYNVLTTQYIFLA